MNASNKDHMKLRLGLFILTLLVLPSSGFAYVSPGAGMTAIGAVLAVIGTVLVVFLGILFWPIRLLFRWIKKNLNIKKKP